MKETETATRKKKKKKRNFEFSAMSTVLTFKTKQEKRFRREMEANKGGKKKSAGRIESTCRWEKPQRQKKENRCLGHSEGKGNGD